MAEEINIPKVVLLLLGLGVASYSLWYIFATLRSEMSKELHVHEFYRNN